MIKYFVYCAECNDIAIDIFKIDIEKNIYLECMTNDEYTLGKNQVNKMLANNGSYQSPLERAREDSLFDTLEDAINCRNEIINEALDCYDDDYYEE